MKIPRHIVWSFDKADELYLTAPENRRWWIKQVLMNGRMEDIRCLDLDEDTTRPVSAKTYKKALERLLCQAENP